MMTDYDVLYLKLISARVKEIAARCALEFAIWQLTQALKEK